MLFDNFLRNIYRQLSDETNIRYACKRVSDALNIKLTPAIKDHVICLVREALNEQFNEQYNNRKVILMNKITVPNDRQVTDIIVGNAEGTQFRVTVCTETVSKLALFSEYFWYF
jgi:hypothetical protein